MKTHHVRPIMWAAVAVMLVGSIASAEVLVEERFDYEQGANLAGLNGGTGFEGPWTDAYDAAGDRDVIIENGAALLRHNGAVSRKLKTWIGGDRTIYIAFRASFIDDHYSAVRFRWKSGVRMSIRTDDTDPTSVVLNRRGQKTRLHELDGKQRLYVMKVDYAANGNEKVTVWLDPKSESDQPATTVSDVDYLEFTNVFLTANRVSGDAGFAELIVDDLVIATSFEDATGLEAEPDPEPAMLPWLLGLAGCGLFCMRGSRSSRARGV